MPQVPYNPVPTVAPTERGTPSINVSTPAAAFGGTVGPALEHLGKQFEHTGDELFKRAIALQELQNDTVAREADTQYMIKAGELHAKFSSLEGANASPAALKQYSADLQSLRTSIRQGLPNDAARKIYDPSSMQTMGRSIFNGAGHAATQMKRAASGTAIAQADMIKNRIYNDPSDEVGYGSGLKDLAGIGQTLAGLEGWTPDQYKNWLDKQTSSALAHRITGVAKNEPFKAEEMMIKFANKLYLDDKDKVENIVRTQTRNTGARIEETKINADFNKPPVEGEPERSLETRVQESQVRAKEIAPNDPLFAEALKQRVISGYQQHKKIVKDTENQNSEDINTAIMGGFSNGKVPTNIDEFKAVSPQVANIYDSLPPRKQLEIPGKINRYNAAITKQTHEETATKLVGRSINDVEGFLNTDITQEPLSQPDMRKFMKMQDDKRKNAAADPRVTRAIGQLRSSMGDQLEALNVYRRTDSNKEDYDHFTGTLQSALEIWQSENKKPPTYEEITKIIGPQVIKQTKVPGLIFGDWWPGKSDPFFKQTVPDKFKTELKNDVVSKGGDEPNDEQIYKAYVRTQLLKLYSKKPVASQSPFDE